MRGLDLPRHPISRPPTSRKVGGAPQELLRDTVARATVIDTHVRIAEGWRSEFHDAAAERVAGITACLAAYYGGRYDVVQVNSELAQLASQHPRSIDLLHSTQSLPMEPTQRGTTPLDLISDILDRRTPFRKRLAQLLMLCALLLVGVVAWLPEPKRTELADFVQAQFRSRPSTFVAAVATVAADSARALEARLPALSDGTNLQYFTSSPTSAESIALITLLRHRGFRVTTQASPRGPAKTVVWCGSQISAGECVLVAVRALQAGFTVIQVFRYSPSGDKPRLIQIGHNSILDHLEPYSIAQLMSLIQTGLAADRTLR